MKSAIEKFLKQNKISVPKGVSPSGSTSEQARQLYGIIRDKIQRGVNLTVDPGDLVRIGKDGIPDLNLSAPIAYDVWYLWKTANFLPVDKGEAETYLDNRLPFLYDNMGVRPLRTVTSRDHISHYEETWFTKDYFENNAPYYIHLMVFETRRQDQEFQRGSDKEPSGTHHGFIAFPVGQLGVMRVISVFGESDTDGIVLSPLAETGGGMFPPRTEAWNECFGTHMYENAWVKQNERVEYPASITNILPHHWMRWWIRDDDTFPYPGEFVGMLCKPLSVPPHVWWFQETYPLLMAGNWFETQYYSSGLVTAKQELGDFYIYRVKFHGLQFWVIPTDFYEYEVGERVTILKNNMTDFAEVFSFEYLYELDSSFENDGAFNEETDVLYGGIHIIPVSFYEV